MRPSDNGARGDFLLGITSGDAARLRRRGHILITPALAALQFGSLVITEPLRLLFPGTKTINGYLILPRF